MASLLSSSRLKLQLILIVSLVCVSTCAKPEAGKWIVPNVSKENSVLSFVKSMYTGTEISVLFECETASKLNVKWLVRRSPCAQEYSGMEINEFNKEIVLQNPGVKFLKAEDYTETEYLNGDEVIQCDSKGDHIFMPLHKYKAPTVVTFPKEQSTTNTTDQNAPEAKGPKAPETEGQKAPETEGQKAPDTEGQKASEGQDSEANKRARREAADPVPAQQDPPQDKEDGTAEVDKAQEKAEQASKQEGKTETPAPTSTPKSTLDGETFLSVWKDGYYLLAMQIISMEETDTDFKLTVTVKTLWNEKYISAGDWPLLIFYGVMGLVYIGYGIFWLFMLACNWRDLLRIQFWIGAVIMLGMLEKAVFFAEYKNISSQGEPVPGAIIFAELVSCVKRGLARMLVIIVSLGFGIVKPRLGQTLHKVVLVGVLYIVLASVEGCMRVVKVRADQSTEWMYAAVPLAVTDAVICWWIFSCLLQTTRTLRLRRNVVKLSLYRHFTNTLIFAVIASVAYMIWFLTQHRFKLCLKDWKELWVDEAFWHLLFSVILFIIMILWRPTANNQRYAFSPLLDAAEDDLDDDQVLSEAFDGMKMRTTKPQQRNGSPFEEKKLEDDLKWVEENIPSSITDKLLPALDSDEEIMNTKFEVSKME